MDIKLDALATTSSVTPVEGSNPLAFLDRIEKFMSTVNTTLETINKLRTGAMPANQSGPMPPIALATGGPPNAPPFVPKIGPMEMARPLLLRVIAALQSYETGITGGKGSDNIVDAIKGLNLSVTDVRSMVEKLVKG